MSAMSPIHAAQRPLRRAEASAYLLEKHGIQRKPSNARQIGRNRRRARISPRWQGAALLASRSRRVRGKDHVSTCSFDFGAS